MPPRAVSQTTRPVAAIPTHSVSPTTNFTPASAPGTVAPTLPPQPPTTTVIVTSVFVQPPTTIAPPPPPATTLSTAVYTTVTQVLTTVPAASAILPLTTARTTVSDTTDTPTTYTHTIGAASSAWRSSSLGYSSSSARPSASGIPSSAPAFHKPKSNTGKYVGYAIGAFFLFLLVSSFISAYRKHRKFVRTRPRGSIFIGGKLSDGQSTPPKRSMAQALMRSVSNRSFDAYALSNTPPTSPAPVYRQSSQLSHPESLLITHARGRGYSTASPIHIRPLPPTPQTIHTMNEKDAAVFTPTAADPHEHSRYSPFGVSSSGSSTRTMDLRWPPMGDQQ